MSVKLDSGKNHVAVGEKSCILCSEKFEYAAVVSGERNPEEWPLLYIGKAVSDQVVVLKNSAANNGQLQLVDIEITVRCPHCHSNNRFSEYLTIQSQEK